MSVSPSGSQVREQEERVMIFMALALGLILTALLFAWFSPGSLASLVPAGWWERSEEVALAPEPVVSPAGQDVSPAFSGGEASASAVALRAASARLALLESDNAELQSKLRLQEQRLAASVPASDLAALEKEMNVLKDLVVELNGTSKRHEFRAAEGAKDLLAARSALQTARGDLERSAASEAKFRRLSEQETAALQKTRADLAKLQTQFAQLKALKASDLSQLEANGRKAIEDLKARLAVAEKDREAAVVELERMILREKAAQGGQPMPAPPAVTAPIGSSEEGVPLQRQLKAAQERIRELEEKLKSQPGARSEVRTDVFRKSSDWAALPAEAVHPGDLWIGAVPLFQTLKLSTHAKETVEVRDAYVQSNRLGTLVTRIQFDDAEAQPSGKALAELKRALGGVPPNAYLLAVGYASVEGKSGYNDGLSSRRAQAIVDLVRPLVRDGKVQMVFFGETSQFDSSDLSKNRVVELWRIDP